MSSIANSTWVLTDEQKKTLQEAINNSIPFINPALVNNRPTVMSNDEMLRVENARINLIKAQQEPTKSLAPSTSKLFGTYNKNLILVVLAVAGYFAYKKFKK